MALLIHDQVVHRNGLPTLQVCLHMLPSTSTQPDLSSQTIGLNDIVYLQVKSALNREPRHLKDLHRSLCAAVERDRHGGETRGKAYLPLKEFDLSDSLEFIVYYLRIGLPLSLESRVKVLGLANHKFN